MPAVVRLPAKRSKYRNIPTVVDNVRFASKKEAARYLELKALQKAYKIFGLELQTRYVFIVNGTHVGVYVADFSYFLLPSDAALGINRVVEDVKSKATRTDVYRIKRSLMKACHNIEILET